MKIDISNISTTALLSSVRKARKERNLYYLSQEEKNQVKDELNLTALYLYEYLLKTYIVPGRIYTDAKASESLNIPEKTIKNNRLLLIKNNYFYTIVTTNKGTSHYQYFLGKGVVYAYKYFHALFGIDNAKWVSKKFTEEQVKDILKTAKASLKETTEITRIINAARPK